MQCLCDPSQHAMNLVLLLHSSSHHNVHWVSHKVPALTINAATVRIVRFSVIQSLHRW